MTTEGGDKVVVSRVSLARAAFRHATETPFAEEEDYRAACAEAREALEELIGAYAEAKSRALVAEGKLLGYHNAEPGSRLSRQD